VDKVGQLSLLLLLMLLVAFCWLARRLASACQPLLEPEQITASFFRIQAPGGSSSTSAVVGPFASNPLLAQLIGSCISNHAFAMQNGDAKEGLSSLLPAFCILCPMRAV